MYPMLKEGVSLSTFEYEGSKSTHYMIENPAGEAFEVSQTVWDALLQPNGINNLPDGGKEIISLLKRHNIVSTSRFIREDGIFNRFIVVNLESLKNKHLFSTLNRILCVLSIIAFCLLPLLLNTNNAYYFSDEINYGIYIVGILLSVSLHELGHMIAGLAYGYTISDAGILLLGLFPIGAYVAHEEKDDASKIEKIQFALAGVEMNMIVSALCLLVSRMNMYLDYTMISIACVNLVLVAINLLPASSLDGERVLSFLLEVPSVSKLARKWLLNKNRLQKLLKSGLIGYISIGIFTIVILAQVIFYLIIVYNVVIIIPWILSIFI